MTQTVPTPTFTDEFGNSIDSSTGEVLPVEYSREVGPYQPPTEEQFITHDYQLRGSALIPVNSIKEMVLKDASGEIRPKAERVRAAHMLTLYMDGPCELVKDYINQPLQVIGAFEFVIPPNPSYKDRKTGQVVGHGPLPVQKLHVVTEKGRKVMLRFGAKSVGDFVAKWTAAYQDFDWEDFDSVTVMIRQRENGMFTFEEVE